MSDDKDKVVSLVPKGSKEEEKSFDGCELTLSNGTIKIIHCDFFGMSDDMNGFLVFYKDSSDLPLLFLNTNHLESMQLMLNGKKIDE